ncbi:MAG: ABC transporter permease [Bacillota bacterium]|nr:ABC transporter permease [Bacillota bacterium]
MLNIIKKCIILNMRDKKNLVLMILFPIALIGILGSVFNNNFEGTSIGKIDVLYSQTGNGNANKAFEVFKENSKNLNIVFLQVNDESKAVKEIKNAKYSCYIKVNGENDTINFYKNEKQNIEAGLVQNVLTIVTQRYSVITEIAKVNPRIVPELAKDTSANFVSLQSVDKKKTPRAMDYYAVTMLTLIIMYASVGGGMSTIAEKTNKTWERMISSPVYKVQIFIGETIGKLIVTFIQAAVVILFSKYVYNADWGSNITAVIAIIATQIIMAISIGIGVAFIFKSENAVAGILNTLIPFMCFLGGAYIKVDSFTNPVFVFFTKMSPVKWSNDAIFRTVYSNDTSYIIPAIAVNLGIAIVFLMISSMIMRRETA